MKASEAWFNLLGPALMRISMDIMLTCTTTKQGFGFTNGQQQTAGEVGSIAQSTFVEVALHNGRDLDHQLGRLIDAVFAFASNSSVAFLLVDVILEISRRGVAMLMNATEVFGSAGIYAFDEHLRPLRNSSTISGSYQETQASFSFGCFIL